ncbi:E3 ubiquitin-protein ligase At3g02290-like isoform X1 [Cannabis sativa]|uniref:E3 ubiquitin-protein ligase At3g02290-like isoform X1 n=1 Tax=Cannabis sativa TaxID=3483 RepID=UPI0029CA9B0C|nr:E3 ubiquitin-protein ligase At3g02290-like isoform X1 [Cannabis sativa]
MGAFLCCFGCFDDDDDDLAINLEGSPLFDKNKHTTNTNDQDSGKNESKPMTEVVAETNIYEYEVQQEKGDEECPTCLEEYTDENPRITTKCFHHFHLSCIYEWEQRSDRCPICNRVLLIINFFFIFSFLIFFCVAIYN